MAKLRNFLTRFQLQYLKTPVFTVVAMVTAATVCLVTLAAVHLSCLRTRQQLIALRELAAELAQQNQELTERIENLGTVESIRQIAQEELGMVDPDVIIIEEE